MLNRFGRIWLYTPLLNLILKSYLKKVSQREYLRLVRREGDVWRADSGHLYRVDGKPHLGVNTTIRYTQTHRTTVSD